MLNHNNMDIIEIQKTYMFNSKQYGYVGASGESMKGTVIWNEQRHT